MIKRGLAHPAGLLLFALAITACRARSSGSPATPRAAASPAQLEEFAKLALPEGARDVSVSAHTNPNVGRVFEARFVTTEEAARTFCAHNGLGGAITDVVGLNPKKREYFRVQGETSRRPFGCGSTSTQDRGIQREVFVTLPSGEAAVVHVVAFRLPS